MSELEPLKRLQTSPSQQNVLKKKKGTKIPALKEKIKSLEEEN